MSDWTTFPATRIYRLPKVMRRKIGRMIRRGALKVRPNRMFVASSERPKSGNGRAILKHNECS